MNDRTYAPRLSINVNTPKILQYVNHYLSSSIVSLVSIAFILWITGYATPIIVTIQLLNGNPNPTNITQIVINPRTTRPIGTFKAS